MSSPVLLFKDLKLLMQPGAVVVNQGELVQAGAGLEFKMMELAGAADEFIVEMPVDQCFWLSVCHLKNHMAALAVHIQRNINLRRIFRIYQLHGICRCLT